MNACVTGRCWTCGDQVSVYQIIAEEHWTMDRLDGDAMGAWVFETAEDSFKGIPGSFKRLGYEVIVAGESFGCGSKSVEHPMAALKGAGVKLIIADSVSRYSYRNAINLALPVIMCPGISRKIHRDDVVTVDLINGKIINHTTEEILYAEGLGEFAVGIVEKGGLLQYVQGDINEK